MSEHATKHFEEETTWGCGTDGRPTAVLGARTQQLQPATYRVLW